MEWKLKQQFSEQIKIYDEVIQVMTVFACSTEEWNGKCVNKRFTARLQQLADGYTDCKVQLHDGGNYYYYSLYVCNHRDAQYREFYIGAWQSTDIKFIGADRRFDYKAFCQQLAKEISQINSDREAFKKSIEMFDEAQKRYNEISDEWKAFRETLPFPIRPYVTARQDERNHFGSFGF